MNGSMSEPATLREKRHSQPPKHSLDGTGEDRPKRAKVATEKMFALKSSLGRIQKLRRSVARSRSKEVIIHEQCVTNKKVGRNM